MKKSIIIIITLAAFAEFTLAQNINWRSISEEQSHLVYFNFGYDYGATAQVGYSKPLKIFKPVLLSADFSIPMGDDVFDDFKVRYGGQIELFELNGFSATAKAMGNFRRHETDLVRMVSFGSEFSAVVGYYKPTWHVAGEFGFDKAISTHLKHTNTIRDNYPEITDGWYVPTGGQFFYGIQASKTIGESMDISLRAGLTNAQGKDEDALLPYYAQIGLNKRF